MKGFDAARRAAVMNDLLRHVRGRPAELLSFGEVREGLGLRHLVDRGPQEVPLERIVGTLGRIREFNRAFLPRDEALRERWSDVEGLARGAPGFPPVDLYQVGDVFFVVDGHHRVSVARRLGAPTIEANVKEYLTTVPVGAQDSVEDIILKHGRADFLEATGLGPVDDDDYRVTEAAGYERLLDHIRVHRYFRDLDLGREFGWEEAVASWRDLVYRPMIRRIEESAVMEGFPGRTATDLYLFVMDHLHYLRERYGGDEVAEEAAVADFHRRKPVSVLHRWWRRFRDSQPFRVFQENFEKIAASTAMLTISSSSRRPLLAQEIVFDARLGAVVGARFAYLIVSSSATCWSPNTNFSSRWLWMLRSSRSL